MKNTKTVIREGVEEWRCIKGFESLYGISNMGRVRRTGGRLLKPYNVNGYRGVALFRQGVIFRKKVHRLVAQAFISNPENKPQINHKDGNKTNNEVSNLEWATHSENVQHAVDTGLRTYFRVTGEKAINIATNGKNRYMVCFSKNKKKRYVGRYHTLAEAVVVRDSFLVENPDPTASPTSVAR